MTQGGPERPNRVFKTKTFTFIDPEDKTLATAFVLLSDEEQDQKKKAHETNTCLHVFAIAHSIMC